MYQKIEDVPMYQEIKDKVYQASLDGKKIAMFHLQVLLNAAALEGVDPVDFCRRIGVPESYATEFRKMISLARLIEQEGIRFER